jgi:hypothetical protein
LVLHISVDVKQLYELGKKYPWPRPDRCLSCTSRRVWGHGYVPRYFEGYVQPLWVKRLRCPDCGTVYTLRPDLFYRGFRYAIATILSSLMMKIANHRWLSHISRQAQHYWYRGLRLQAFRIRSISFPDMGALQEVMSAGFVPASHALDCAIHRR